MTIYRISDRTPFGNNLIIRLRGNIFRAKEYFDETKLAWEFMPSFVYQRLETKPISREEVRKLILLKELEK